MNIIYFDLPPQKTKCKNRNWFPSSPKKRLKRKGNHVKHEIDDRLK